LIDLRRSRTRAAVVRELFLFPGAEIHVRALARLTGEAVANVHRELRRLQAEGWLTARPSGNRVLYRVDTDHRLYQEVGRLVEETIGAAGLLREALAELSEVRLALLFRPPGPATGRRDLLLLVVGPTSAEDVSEAVAPAAAVLRAVVQPLVFGSDELLGRLRERDARTLQLLEAPHTVVKGDEGALRAMIAALRP
jgi:DNA-binding transcriptional ArsR family regulator